MDKSTDPVPKEKFLDLDWVKQVLNTREADLPRSHGLFVVQQARAVLGRGAPPKEDETATRDKLVELRHLGHGQLRSHATSVSSVPR